MVTPQAPSVLSLGRVRLLLSMALVLGLLTVIVERTTFAGFFTTVYFTGNKFQTGTVDIAGLLDPTTASTLPSATAFKWDSTGAGAECANVLTGLDVRTQAMAPGQFCVHTVSIRNMNPVSVAAWLRLRLVRETPPGTTMTEALNNRLRFYMSEYGAGSARTADAYQAADCNVASFRPVSPGGGAKSTATIADVNSATQGSRTALLSIGAAGKNIGLHPGISAPTDPAITQLQGTGLGIVSGVGLLAGGGPNLATMTTDAAAAGTRNAFNLIGNDEVKNPRRITNSNENAGTRPSGTLPEAAVAALTTRHYCVAIYFPSDTDLTVTNLAGDNAAAIGNLTYYLVVDTSQQANNKFD